MADTLPPDANKRAGRKRGHKSGKVADFRYKRPFQPKGATVEDRPSGNPCDKANAASSRNGGAPKAANRPYAPRPREAYAALDLGTNNCRLLIARPSGKDFTVIDAFSRVVKLGEALATPGRLSDEAMDRALGALLVCSDKLRRRNVRLARSVATAACRRAENGADFIERVTMADRTFHDSTVF